MRTRGFTLFELLLVLGVFILLGLLALPALRSFRAGSDLTSSVNGVVSAIGLAHSRTLASEGPAQWGVYFDDTASPKQYILFQGPKYASRDMSFDEIYQISESVEIYELNLAGGKEVVFNRVRGDTAQPGTIKMRLIADLSQAQTIGVDSSGRAFSGEEISPSALPQKDSRHVHFDYNQNVQDATTLKLIFPDYPDDNYNIDFQTYLNADKTEFSWEGTVSVGPAGNKTDQQLKIHTHSLTIVDAQFCVHRDRGYNDKPLSITLDTENLINYTATGEESKGLSFWVEEPQRQ